MARVIGVVNQKGGVGKTTTSVNLATYLAAMGKYVLLVDLDPQANATSGLGFRLDNDHLNIYNVLVDELEPTPILKKTLILGYDLLPASQSLAGATVELVGMQDREFKLKQALNKVRTNYDYILIDCPPSLGLLTVNALVASEYVLIPVQTEYYSLEGLSQLLKTIGLIKQGINPDLQVLGILLTMYDKRNQLSRRVLKEIHRNFQGKIFEAVVPRTISLAEAPSFGKTILQYDPGSKGAKTYRLLAQEIVGLLG